MNIKDKFDWVHYDHFVPDIRVNPSGSMIFPCNYFHRCEDWNRRCANIDELHRTKGLKNSWIGVLSRSASEERSELNHSIYTGHIPVSVMVDRAINGVNKCFYETSVEGKIMVKDQNGFLRFLTEEEKALYHELVAEQERGSCAEADAEKIKSMIRNAAIYYQDAPFDYLVSVYNIILQNEHSPTEAEAAIRSIAKSIGENDLIAAVLNHIRGNITIDESEFFAILFK